MHTGKQVRDFLEPVAQCAEQDTLDQVLDMLGAGNPVAVRWQGRWRLLYPKVVAGYSPSLRVTDLPLTDACLMIPDLPAQDALTQLIDRGTPYALVVGGDRLIGIVTQIRLLEYTADVEHTWIESALRTSEARLRSAFQNAPFDFWVCDRDGRCIYQNPAAIKQWGDQVGKTLEECDVDEETLTMWQRNKVRALAGEIIEGEVKYVRHGEARHFHNIVAPTLLGGEVDGILGFSVDITERKRAEEALRESEARYRSLFENSFDGVLLTAPDGRILAANPEACRIFGRTEEELRQVGRAGVVDATDPRLAALLEERSRTGRCRGELTQLRGDGTTFEAEISSAVFTDRDGATRTSMIIRDITERKRAEEGLRQSEAKAVQLGRETAIMAEIGRIIGSTLTIDEVYEGFSEEVKKILPFDRIVINVIDADQGAVRNVYIAGEELQDRNVQDIYPLQGSGNAEMVRTRSSLLIQTEDFSEYRDRFPMLVSTFQAGFRSILNVPLFSKGKLIGGLLLRSRQPFAYTEKDVRLAERIGSQIAGAVANSRLYEAAQCEIAERKQVEVMLQQAKDYAEKIIETANVIVLGLDSAGGIQVFNEAAETITGYTRDELAGRDYFEVIAPRDRYPHVWEAFGELVTNDLPTFENPILTKYGEERVISWRKSQIREQGKIVGTISFGMDVTERRRAEETLRQRTQQLEAIRAVTAEITRELNPTILLQLITRRAVELLGVASGTVWLWDEEGQILVPKAWHGSAEWRGEVCLRLGEAVGGTAAQRREGLIVNHYRTSPYALPIFMERTDVTAVMAEPLMYRERLLGVITIDNTGIGRLFTEQDREILVLFAAQASVAIENARLLSAALERERQLKALLRAGRSVLSGLKIEETLQHIVEEAAEIAGTPHVKVILVDEHSRHLRLGAVAGRPPWMLADFRLTLGTGLSGLVAVTGQSLYVPDCQHDARNLYADQDRELGLVTYLGLPIRIRDNVVGVLTFNTTQPREYAQEEMAYLTSFANQAAIAIENARLFESVREQHAQLRNLTTRLADVGETQRQRLSQELHDCVGGDLAALNLNLGIVQTQLLAVGAANATTRIAECMRLAEESARHIRSVMTELRPPLLDDQGLMAALRWYTDQFSARTGVGVAMRGEEARPRLSRSTEIALFRIAQEVLTNVAKHAQAGEVTLMIEEMAEKVRLTIADDGVGFDPATVRPHGKQPWWGLMTMRERAVAIGASLRVESASGSGTRVIVEVPR